MSVAAVMPIYPLLSVNALWLSHGKDLKLLVQQALVAQHTTGCHGWTLL
jgi:hypothetical protein